MGLHSCVIENGHVRQLLERLIAVAPDSIHMYEDVYCKGMELSWVTETLLVAISFGVSKQLELCPLPSLATSSEDGSSPSFFALAPTEEAFLNLLPATWLKLGEGMEW